jgi:stringent starvation protein B
MVSALHQWILDNDMTPEITVNIDFPGVDLPSEFAIDGMMILSIAERTAKNLVMAKDHISFTTTFKGKIHEAYIPLGALVSIHAKETSVGMMFSDSETFEEEESLSEKRRANIHLVT